MTFASMPKVELHLHHEAAAPPDFVRRIAAEKKIDISKCFDEHGNYAFKDFGHFIEVYDGATKALTTPEDFRRLTYRALEETAKSGVIYAETFLSPDFCGKSDVVAWKEFLAAIKEGADAAEAEFGIVHRAIITCLRHEGPETAIPAAKCAAETAGDYVVGFGMAGAEMMGRPSDFAYSFDMAREAGLRLTCHAGEWGGPDMVADTLRDLKVERIGHGINAIHDDALVDQLARDGVVLEVCPGSNVVLQAVTGWDAHPIAKLRERGVKVTVSTDDPPFFATTMTKEFENLHRVFGWDRADFDEINTTAIEAAFCDDATRALIVKRLEAAKND